MDEKSEKYVLRKKIGGRMRELRKRLRLTQEDMAPHCGVGRADLSRIEKGEVFPGVFLLVNLTKKFNLSLPWILLNEGDVFGMDAESMKKQEGFFVHGEELQKLFAHLEKIPLLRHRILTQFYEMKGNFKEQFDAEMDCSEEPSPSEPPINN